MNKKKHIAIHILCWVALLSYFLIGYFLDGGKFNELSPFGFSIYLAHIPEFYICYLWVFPAFLKRSKIPQLVAGILFAMTAHIFLRYLVEEVTFPYFWGIRNYNEKTPILYYVRDNIYYSTSYIVIAAAVWSSQNALKNERMNQQLRDEAVKAELSFLKSQINPHFLYNTLNYIYALAMPVSEKLSNAVLRLSDLMRYTLSESTDGKVSLLKELDYLESYVELFKMRFEPNFYVRFEAHGVNENQRVASLLLIPLVENAFKHGVLNDAENPVLIEIKVLNKKLVATVSNKINHSHKDKSSGIGLINVHRRLTLIYPGQHDLQIKNDGKFYESILTLELS